ncbi:MAG: energy transducer TonB [Flavobacteriales bacterium]|nr:energy transducer TonB [Flavobacteriales bacterium]MCB9167421.1 energy transducer TonB [Flavobacteriales bacterium]
MVQNELDLSVNRARYQIILPLCLSTSLLSAASLAQEPARVYLDQVLHVTVEKKAVYYRQNEGMQGTYFLGRTYTMSGKLKAEGTYVDADLLLEQGHFIFYHPNGRVESTGDYSMGRKTGVWLRYDAKGDELAEKVYDPEPLEDILYTRAEVMPQYPGGDRELVHYVRDRVVAKDGMRVRGKITASFVVEKDGHLSDVKVVEGQGEELDERVVNALKSTLPWSPGTEKGQPVRVQVKLPVPF